MRILLWHGYLMRGSGSNVYTANVAREWRAQGHDVLVLCQERDVTDLAFVDGDGDLAPDNGSFEVVPTGVPRAPGRCRVVRPAIGSILPVYVYDAYEGFEAKLFVDLTDDELDRYVSSNVAALVTAIESHRPEAIITGHEVMGPEIARRACSSTGHRYVAKLHGSALEYAVKEQRRYLDHALRGLNGAHAVVGGSHYMLREASSVVGGWMDKAHVVNPGCDVDLFRPDPSSRDQSPTIGFVGKFIASKGLHHLLGALGLTSTSGLRLVVVGYGGWDEELRDLAGTLRIGDLERASDLVGDWDDADREPLAGFLSSMLHNDAYRARAREIAVTFTGRLEHGPLAEVLPTFDALVVPSVLAEAFGMVAAEAAACGVLPIVPGHSGIGEAGAAVEEAIGRPRLLTFDPGDPIRGVASAIDEVLAIPRVRRAELETAASELARSRWAWSHVARELLRIATHG